MSETPALDQSETRNVDQKKQRRRAIIFCAISSPAIMVLLNSWYWLIETLRVDNYGYGPVFHTLVYSTALLCNAIIVAVTYRPSTLEQKAKLWVKASFIAFLVVVGIGLAVSLFWFLAFAFGPKIGG